MGHENLFLLLMYDFPKSVWKVELRLFLNYLYKYGWMPGFQPAIETIIHCLNLGEA